MYQLSSGGLRVMVCITLSISIGSYIVGGATEVAQAFYECEPSIPWLLVPSRVHRSVYYLERCLLNDPGFFGSRIWLKDGMLLLVVIVITTGSILVSPGSVITTGSILVSPGSVISTGSILVSPGSVITTGSILVSPGSVITTGSILVSPGSVITTGSILVSPGSVITTGVYSIQEFFEKHYDDILPIIMEKARQDKRKGLQSRLDFGDTPKRARRIRSDSLSSGAKARVCSIELPTSTIDGYKDHQSSCSYYSHATKKYVKDPRDSHNINSKRTGNY
ncbi:hypothetical protein Tco_0716763 [Tanacetum coccineum]